jgi:Arc/MetJ-type ribon-helix-helix transcriptional regulator
MSSIEAKIPDELDRQIDALVDEGWFRSRDQLVQEAIRRLLESHRPELMERFIQDDVEWGLRGSS